MMQYMGGKARIARRIVKAIMLDTAERTRWFEPFVGGGNVMEIAAPYFESSYGTDIHSDLIMLLWAIRNGWIPPDLTKDMYQTLRNAESSALRGYAGFGASFGGKWFGGYGISPRDGEVWKASQRALVRQGAIFRNANTYFACKRFGEVKPDLKTVVYCDPPYMGTTRYTTGPFDYVSYYQTLIQWTNELHCHVYASEYDIPDWVPCTVIWQREKRMVLEKGNNRLTVIEKLYRIG